MKKQVLSFDLDDTLFDAVKNFIPFTNKTYGTQFVFNKVRNSDVLNSRIPIKKEIARWKKFFESKDGMSEKPEPEVRNAINKLSKRYSLIIVSARDLELQGSAKKWVGIHFPRMFSKIVFIKRRTGKLSKADVCIKNKSILHIDDNPKHIIDCVNKKVSCILVNRPWNKNRSFSVKRINNVNYADIIKELII